MANPVKGMREKLLPLPNKVQERKGNHLTYMIKLLRTLVMRIRGHKEDKLIILIRIFPKIQQQQRCKQGYNKQQLLTSHSESYTKGIDWNRKDIPARKALQVKSRHIVRNR